MDAFDFREERPRSAGLKSGLVWNILTVVVLLSIVCVVGASLMIFINPDSAINPFRPQGNVAPTPSVVRPTATPTKRGLPPTWTPAPTTPVSTNTPRPTATPIMTETPIGWPTATQPEVTLTPGGMSYVPQGEPQAIRDYLHEECKWMGVGGSVFDLRGSPVTGLIVQLGGTLEGKLFDMQTSMTGIALQYGESGYEFTIADHPIASNGTLWVQLADQAGLPLSNKIHFNTYDDCQKNLIVITFKQMK